MLIGDIFELKKKLLLIAPVSPKQMYRFLPQKAHNTDI